MTEIKMTEIKQWIACAVVDNSDALSISSSQFTDDDMTIYTHIHWYHDDDSPDEYHRYARKNTNQIVLSLRKVKRCPICKEAGHYSKTCPFK